MFQATIPFQDLLPLKQEVLQSWNELQWTQLFASWMACSKEEQRDILDGLAEQASALRDQIYGHQVFIRGLIEYSNICQNDCYYCGIRRSNHSLPRYRLTPEEVETACCLAEELGIRTLVLQGGENAQDDVLLPPIIRKIRSQHPKMALTLSLGEKSESLYRLFREAGADRYLLRHETADPKHYQQLHPASMHLTHRMHCLQTLRDLGFQTGCGFMVGSPGQTPETLARDFLWMQQLQPQMVGIGPFIPHHQTPFAHEPAGSVSTTRLCLSLTRLLLPTVLLPSTTALATCEEDGHLLGLASGANVIMPNLTPLERRKLYTLYDGKKSTGTEAAEGYRLLCAKLRQAGYTVESTRGDHITYKEN